MDLKHLIKEIKYYKELDSGLKRVGAKFILTRTPLKKIVNLPIYNKFYSYVIKKKSKKVKPYMLTIEVASICNAKCIMCPYVSMKRKKKIMDGKTFKNVLKKIMKNEKIKYVKFTGLGEPLCDKDLEEKISYLNKNYDTNVVIFTNAGLLTKERTEKLLKLDIFKVNFSINGVEEEYKKSMDLDYKKTLENVKYFIKRKKELNKKYPLVNVSSLIINEKQKRDFEKFEKEWLSKVDSITPCIPSNWSGKLDEKMVKKSFRNKMWACISLWKELFVNVEGDVVLCHIDYECDKKFGNLNKDSYEIIKRNLQETKDQHLQGKFVPKACKNCVSSFDTSVDWWGDIK